MQGSWQYKRKQNISHGIYLTNNFDHDHEAQDLFPGICLACVAGGCGEVSRWAFVEGKELRAIQ